MFAAPLFDAKAQGGTVEGDVYLVMKSGDTKKAAGREVLAVRFGAAVADSSRSICQNRDRQLLALAVPDTARERAFYAVRDRFIAGRADAERAGRRVDASYYDDSLRNHLAAEANRVRGVGEMGALHVREAVESLRQLHVRHAAARAPTGMNAHYRFASLRPGPYLLRTEWQIVDNDYLWLAPVTLKPGERRTLDLDNARVIEGRDICKFFAP